MFDISLRCSLLSEAAEFWSGEKRFTVGILGIAWAVLSGSKSSAASRAGLESARPGLLDVEQFVFPFPQTHFPNLCVAQKG